MLHKNPDGHIKPTDEYVKSQRILGTGSFSTVYKGYEKSSGIPVAIKVAKKGEKKMAEKEIKLLKKLEPHPNIVRFYTGKFLVNSSN